MVDKIIGAAVAVVVLVIIIQALVEIIAPFAWMIGLAIALLPVAVIVIRIFNNRNKA
ncbi:hypothetical protein GS464_29455 [Rhodococcus hoagii]|nr:hypothetical protein [Prescottella equi]